MTMRIRAWIFLALIHGFVLIPSGYADDQNRLDEPIDFNLRIRPILSKNCFRCHGFDEKSRQAGLRLDLVEGATGNADSGKRAIVPRKPDESELLRRVISSDPDLQMPPDKAGKRLSDAQILLLRRWIEGGAAYSEHWAFVKPKQPRLPEIDRDEWSRNAIDRFVLDRLLQEGLHPTVEADPARLLRRVSLDLIGLPPTLEELTDYLAHARHDPDGAYRIAVDRLLSSPHFGERMAIDWMDAARYADTNGYFGDRPRQAWPWRDWVIAAFNANMPFNQFTIDQLAGDLIPDATRDQQTATGFHRNAMANNETGIIDEEYRIEAVADRVDTTASVWMGMTLGCAQCHDHKYDPISQREYYQFFAYFNNSVEPGLVTSDSPPPTIEVPTAEQVKERNRRQQRLIELENHFVQIAQTLDQDLAEWQRTALEQLIEPIPASTISFDFDSPTDAAQSIGTAIKKEIGIRCDAGVFDATQHLELPIVFDADRGWTILTWFKPDTSLGCLLSKIEPTDRRRGFEVMWQKGRLQVNLVHQWGVDEIAAVTQLKLTPKEWHHVLIRYDGSGKGTGLRLTIDGRDAALTFRRDQLTGSIACDEPLRIGRRDSGSGFYGSLDQIAILPRLVSDSDATSWSANERLRGILERPAPKRTASDLKFVKEHFIEKHAAAEIQIAYKAQEEARQSLAEMRRMIPTTLVMEDRKVIRPTYMLTRGQYDQQSEEVTAAVPAIFPKVADDADRNRLTLARWLVSSDHPLTARVIVNRLWQHCFGDGLVRTPNDFGSQGERPTHPEMLDHLAVQFIESGWDIKRMLRMIVTSATYRQSSKASVELLRRDPENRLLAHGPRFRLAAELLRDSALSTSGLLSRKLGGPSAKPYQPEGLWEEVSYNEDDSYVQDTDDSLWRRSLYTYSKRQAPPPAQLTFDAGTREKCLIRRSRTNTPLQALVMLNDPTWIEASRVLAEVTLTSSTDDIERMRTMFRRVMSRDPEPHESQLLKELLSRQQARYVSDVTGAKRLISVGSAPSDPRIPASELAAWTIVAQTILNLDEVVTRR